MEGRKEDKRKEVSGKGEYEGILYKKPTNWSAYLSWSGWRSRYCVADDERLKYYGKKGDPMPRGVVEFSENCRVENKGLDTQQGLYIFDIVMNKDNVVSFASKSKQDAEIWTNVLEQKIRSASLKKHVRRWKSASSTDAPVLGNEEEDPALVGEGGETDDDVSDPETKLGAGATETTPERHALYGNAPGGFQTIFYNLLRQEACLNSVGWDLIGLQRGSRIFERKSKYAGNSSTDLNGIVEDVAGVVEMKCISSIPALASHTFAMFMDLSSSRQMWDASFASGSIVRKVDDHNDVITIESKPLIPYLIKSRSMELDRYWCRESSGTFIILCKSTARKPYSSNSSKSVVCDVDYMYVTIAPRARTNGVPWSTVTIGFRMNVSGWMQYCKPLARLDVLARLSCIQNLRSSASFSTVSFGEPPRYSETSLPFRCDLQTAFVKAADEKDEDLNFSDPYVIVKFLQQNNNIRRNASAGQLSAFERAKQVMDQEKKRIAEMKGKTSSHGDRETHSRSEEGAVSQQNYDDCDDDCDSDDEGEDEDDEDDCDETGSVDSGSSSGGNGDKETRPEEEEEGGEVALNYEYGMPRNNCILPMAISKEGISAWWDSGVEKGYWKVRGPNYLQDKVKIPNEVSAMELLQTQWSFFDNPKRNIAADKDELVQLQHEGRADRPFLLVINFMVPTIGNWVCYFTKRRTVQDDTFDRMFSEFVNGSDDHRNNRFKIIPSVVEGSYFAKKGIGNTPAILGKKLTTTYYKGANWFEVCVDVGSSRVAGSLMSLVKSYATTLVIDLAFLIESQKDDELPERLIGGARMHYPLMYPVDDLSQYCKSKELLEQAYLFPPPPTTFGGDLKEKEKRSSKKAKKKSKKSKETLSSKREKKTNEKASKQDNPGGVTPPSSPKLTNRNRSGTSVLDYNYSIPENNFLVPMGQSKSGQSAWWDSGTDIGYWKLRGPTYLIDKIKVPSDVSAMELVQMQWSFYPTPKRHISSDPNELVQKEHIGRLDRPFLFVVNFMVPTIGNWVCYFAKRRGVTDPRFDKMLNEFITAPDDKFRNDRFKIIPSVVEGYFVARKAIGNKPAILGRKIETKYYSGANYFEVCVNVGSSLIAERLLGVVKSYASSLVIDLAFLFESITEDELPERLLGGARMHFPLMYQMSREEFQATYCKESTLATPSSP